MAVDQNKEQFQKDMSSKKTQEEEISLKEIFAECLGGEEAAALLLKENNEQSEGFGSSKRVKNKVASRGRRQRRGR